MSSIIYTTLSTELTCIPGSMERVLGPNFNNTLCNAVTWLFAMLFVLHSCYNKLLNVYLQQIGFTPYLRMRLIDSLWLLAFSVSFFTYYLVTVDESTSVWRLLTVKKDIHGRHEEVPTEKVVVYVVICSFFLHMAYDHGTRLGSLHSVVKFGVLLVVYTSAYTLRYLEIPFALTALMALSGILEELSKMFYSLLDKSSKLSNVFVTGLFIASVVVSCTVYFAAIPLIFLVPLGKTVLFGTSSITEKTLFISLLFWLNFAIYKSVLLNLIFHWLYHRKTLGENDGDERETETLKTGCPGNIIECSTFPPRSDDGFVLAFLRYEIKMRQKRMIAKRTPKNRNMLLQTLKCMVAIKKKLSDRRAANEPDDGVEDTEQDNLIRDENADETEPAEAPDEDFIQMKRSVKMLTFSDVSARTTDDEQNDEATEVEIDKIDNEVDDENKPNTSAVEVDNMAESIVAEALEDVLKKELELGNDDQKEFDGDIAGGCGNGKCKALK